MKLKKLLLIPAVLLLISGCNNSLPESGTITDYDGYYSDIDYSDSGTQLIQKVHNLMIDTHKTYTTYSIFKNTSTYKKTCLNPSTNRIVYFYTGYESTSYSGTREHVWPCGNSSGLWGRDSSTGEDIGEDYKGGGSDMYHIMPCSSKINTFRGNGKFTSFSDEDSCETLTDNNAKYVLKGQGATNKQYSKSVEPADEFKGDIARIVAYLYVHYNSNFGKTNSYTGQLVLSNIFVKPNNEDMSYVYNRLIEWNELDPVDDMEKNRCNEVQKVQGNRNPFIDHPEFISKMFGDEY